MRKASLSHTTDIVSAFIGSNYVPADKLAELISSVHQAISSLNNASNAEPSNQAEVEKHKPAVSVKRSITDDHIISLENGKPYRSLKRHLSQLGMTPDMYRTKWKLPADYPMVAKSYSERRSEVARSMGLGKVSNE